MSTLGRLFRNDRNTPCRSGRERQPVATSSTPAASWPTDGDALVVLAVWEATKEEGLEGEGANQADDPAWLVGGEQQVPHQRTP